eukprot:CAMPEP_0178953968 /NCGR_PEP_ID=MMETSP0789-20121207/8723_1 /TAXON_ID=3005 /ORGANISM="Rhizosolenia setigera, Strain CCMP 1694" /LENGTH=1023 /DNA_ID=CAMNT_0020635305 /DNA_START=31 /DNA_END=3102 /DNA_ORIENTATION=-
MDGLPSPPPRDVVGDGFDRDTTVHGSNKKSSPPASNNNNLRDLLREQESFRNSSVLGVNNNSSSGGIPLKISANLNNNNNTSSGSGVDYNPNTSSSTAGTGAGGAGSSGNNLNFSINENTPAARALRASAAVKVTKFDKYIGRKTKLNVLGSSIKQATTRQRTRHKKPPRVPPSTESELEYMYGNGMSGGVVGRPGSLLSQSVTQARAQFINNQGAAPPVNEQTTDISVVSEELKDDDDESSLNNEKDMEAKDDQDEEILEKKKQSKKKKQRKFPKLHNQQSESRPHALDNLPSDMIDTANSNAAVSPTSLLTPSSQKSYQKTPTGGASVAFKTSSLFSSSDAAVTDAKNNSFTRRNNNHHHNKDRGDKKSSASPATSESMKDTKENKPKRRRSDYYKAERRWKSVRDHKKKKGKKNHAKNIKGNIIDEEHKHYALSIAMMLGLRTSINITNGRLSQMKDSNKNFNNTDTLNTNNSGRSTDQSNAAAWLNNADFMKVEKYIFPPKGGPRYGHGPKTPPHDLGHTFKFKDYSPMTFAYLRRMYGVNEYDFLSSVCGDANFIEFISNAKSGQFLFFSTDGRFLIKTMSEEESRFLRRILPHYFEHCIKNPNTFISRFFGMYRVKLYHLQKEVKFLIMNNVHYTSKYVQAFYDLKGSVTFRNAKPTHECQKDNDLRAMLPENAFLLKPEVRKRVREQITRDCEFLNAMKIMDYSMICFVHHINPVNVNTTNSGRSTIMQNQQATPSSSVNARKSAVAATAGGLAPDGNNIHQNKAEEDYRDILANNGGEASISSLNTFDQIFLAEDDENSLLDGATEESIKHEKELPLSYQMKRDEVTKRFFWPFHRMFDIHGRRKLDIHSKEPVVYNSTTAKEWDIPTFVNPISERVDRGLNMDITDKATTTPFEYKIRGPQVIGKCEGKIYYMGIIDILQQFNLKKRVEARYRRLSGSGWQDASCVHPELYAERFLKFFDEYTSKHYDPLKKKEEEEEDSEDEENVEQVVFHEEGKEPGEEGEGENRRPLFNDQ